MKKYIALFLFLVMAVSCQNFLDIKPHEEVIPSTAEEFSALLHTHLDNMDNGSQDYPIPSTSGVTYYDQIADNLEVALSSSRSILYSYPGEMYGGTGSKSTTLYSNFYSLIRDCNIIFGELTERESDMARDVLGTAYALRGISYYELLWRFCQPVDPSRDDQLGLQLVATFDMEERPLRSSMQETIEFIEDDLLKALSYNVQTPVYRFTAPVVKGYLARFYFWTHQWEKAVEWANEVLSEYPLLDREGYREMMTPSYTPKGNMIIKSEILSSSSTDESAGKYTPLNERPLSLRFLNTFNEKEKTDDIRYEMGVNNARVATKFIFSGMRSAEMLLIRAESHYHLGHTEEALADINDLRSRRIKDYTPLTLETLPEPLLDGYISADANGNELTPLIAMILTERRKELLLEGDRFFELKRNGCPEFWVPIKSTGQKYVTYSFMYTYPIPEKDVEILPGLQQNEGYEKYLTR